MGENRHIFASVLIRIVFRFRRGIYKGDGFVKSPPLYRLLFSLFLPIKKRAKICSGILQFERGTEIRAPSVLVCVFTEPLQKQPLGKMHGFILDIHQGIGIP